MIQDFSPPFTEEDLQAYIDNQLSPEQATIVAQYIKNNPEIIQRLTAYQQQKQWLQQAFQNASPRPVIWPETSSASSWFFIRKQMAAAAVLVIVAATIGWQANSYFHQRSTTLETSIAHNAVPLEQITPSASTIDNSYSLSMPATLNSPAIPSFSAEPIIRMPVGKYDLQEYGLQEMPSDSYSAPAISPDNEAMPSHPSSM